MTPEQNLHCEGIIHKFTSEFREKYAKGQREHGGHMLQKPGMLGHAIEEVIDLVAYLYTLKEQTARGVVPDPDLPPVVYIAGPFRHKDSWGMENNIRRAEEAALEVWRMGAAALCPHTNTRFYQGAAPDDVWLTGDLAMLAKCDAVLMLPTWAQSQGATAERRFAEQRGIPVFETLEQLAAWVGRSQADAKELVAKAG